MPPTSPPLCSRGSPQGGRSAGIPWISHETTHLETYNETRNIHTRGYRSEKLQFWEESLTATFLARRRRAPFSRNTLILSLLYLAPVPPEQCWRPHVSANLPLSYAANIARGVRGARESRRHGGPESVGSGAFSALLAWNERCEFHGRFMYVSK